MIETNTIEQSFKKAYRLAKENKFESNSLKSSLFVQMVGEEILKSYDGSHYSIHCQKVDLGTNKKQSGEWLLDAIIAKKHEVKEKAVNNLVIIKSMIVQVEWAIESEYATSLQAFLDDFSKLLSFKAKNKLYLNGYSSTNFSSFDNYKNERLKTASDLIKKFDKEGNYYFCFWPSPEKKGNDSFWEKIKNEHDLQSKIMTLHKWDNNNLSFSPLHNLPNKC